MYTQEQINKIIELKESGLGVTQIGRELHLDRRHVSKYLKQLGYSTDRNTVDKNLFKKIDSEEKAYWLGFLYADGNLNSTTYQISIGLQESDIEHLEKFKKFTKCNNKISYSKNSNSYRLCIGCKEMYQDLIKLGCPPRKSLILKFPTDEQVPPKYKKDFMRGYVDGDGCLCYTDKSYSFSFVGTKDFIDKAIEFFNWKTCKYDTTGKAYVWRCANKKLVPGYLQLLYQNSTIYLDRKYEKYKKMINV